MELSFFSIYLFTVTFSWRNLFKLRERCADGLFIRAGGFALTGLISQIIRLKGG